MYIVKSIKYVDDAFLASGSGLLDFEPDIKRIKPDIFVVNHDGHTPEKETLCKKLGIEYIVLERIPEPGLPPTLQFRNKKRFDGSLTGYALPAAGSISPGFQKYIPDQLWWHRSGRQWILMTVQVWQQAQEMSEYRFGVTGILKVIMNKMQECFSVQKILPVKHISQVHRIISDLLYPGINRLYYNGDYWPEKIESTTDKELCDWLSDVLWLVPLEPRPDGYDPLKIMHLEKPLVKELGESGERCWQAILKKDVNGLGKAMKDTFLSWKKILPLTVPDWVMKEMETKYFPGYPGAITSGSGGGYVIVVSEQEIKGSIKIQVRY